MTISFLSRILKYIIVVFSLFLFILGAVTIVDVQIKRLGIGKILTEKVEKKVNAGYQYGPSGGALVTGAEVALSSSNVGTWRAVQGNDSATNGSGNYWTTARNNPNGLDKQVYFDGVEINSANKLIIVVEDANITTATAYVHQICDWQISTDVDNVAGGNCTGGGWRTLHPRKTTLTVTTDTTTTYEIYDGYFVDTATSPGTVVATPLTNFVNTGSGNRVLIRVYSSVASTVQHRWDFAQIEMAIDPIYQPSGFNKTAGGTTTNFLSDLTGASGSDNTKMGIPQSGASVAVDAYYIFQNVDKYTSANTILVAPELIVSNAALTVGTYLRNFTTSAWTQIGSNVAPTADTDEISSFNSTAVSGFNIDDYISGTNEVWVRFFTNAPASVNTLSIDRLYIMLGSVNNDTADCETSWGTPNATTCANTRDIINSQNAAASVNTNTWQTTAVIEYPTGFYGTDNDDDATGSEYAFSNNISFPITYAADASITAGHYAVMYRSNNTAMTRDLNVLAYEGSNGVNNYTVGSGWRATPGTDTNLATTYSYYDTWRISEIQENPEHLISTSTGKANLRLRTSASTNTTVSTVSDWEFAMFSIRYIKEPNRRTLQNLYYATGGNLVVGSEVTVDAANVGSYKGTRGNDSTTNGSGNYWTTARNATNGLNKQLYFDNVQLYGANKMIITIEDTNLVTANNYVHQICDWSVTTLVDNVADAQCTGGGWRTLNALKAASTSTSDNTKIYEIYDGYFWDRTTAPGTVVSTPLNQFIDASNNNRILIRTYSTVASTVQHRTDTTFIEVAIDPIYEPADLVQTNTGTPTGFVSNVFGQAASDNTKLLIPQSGSGVALDFYFVFKNVKKYTGANTILTNFELLLSSGAITQTRSLRNFTTNTWTTLGAASSTVADVNYASSFNSTTIGGFDINDYISGTNEVWLRFNSNAASGVNSISFDRVYIMLGSVNTDSGDCAITWGTANATTCTNTRDLLNDELIGSGSSNTNTWQNAAVIEYPAGHYPADNDDDTTNNEYAMSSNLSFPITISNGEAVTAIHYAVRFRSNSATITMNPELRRYASNTGTNGDNLATGWRDTPGTDTNLSGTYSYYDTLLISEAPKDPEDNLDTVNNEGAMRLRTTASTDITGGFSSDWDFAMMSIRYLSAVQIISVTVSDGSIAYGLVNLNTSKSTVTLSDSQTITNDGSGAQTFNIKGQNTACPWTLSGSVGTDTYKHAFCKNSDVSCAAPPTNYTNLTTSYQTLYTGVGSGVSKGLDLNISVPSTTSCYTQQSVDVTVQAIAN
jgi:hypothetical protein